MTTVLLFVVVAVVVVAAVKAAYWFAITRLLFEQPLADEVHTVTTKDGWKIKLFRYRQREGEGGEPVFICHGFAANHWNFALPNRNGLIDALAERGFDCWVVDLRGNRTSVPPAGMSRHEATFDDYVLNDLPAALAFIREQTKQSKVHWVGHSMGGLLLYAYEAVHGSDELASGTTLGAPPGFKGVVVSRHKRLLSFVRRYPAVAEAYLRALAPLLPLFKPRTALLPINWDNVHEDVGARAFYNLVELPPPSVAETIMDAAVFQFLGVKENSVDVLAKLKGLRTPLLVIHGVLDPIATVENVRTFFDRLPSSDKRRLELSRANGHSADYDHVDLAFAVNGLEEVYAPIAEWIEAHRVMAETQTSEKRVAQPETPIPGRPAPQTAAGEEPVPVPVAARAAKVTMWRTALRNAAKTLTGLDEKSGSDSPPESREEETIVRLSPNRGSRAKRKAPASRRKTVNKKAAAKKASVKKPSAKKRSPKKAASKKAKSKKIPAKKKVAAKRKPAKKKVAKKRPAKKKTAAKRPAKKKAAGKKPAKKKAVTKKAAKKKPAARTKRRK